MSSHPAPARPHKSQLPKTVPRQLLNVSKDTGSITSWGNLGKCSVTFTVKKVFLVFRENLLCLSVCPGPVTGHHWKSCLCALLNFPSDVHADEIPLSPVFPRMSSSRSLILFLQERCSSPFLTMAGDINPRHFLRSYFPSIFLTA